MISWISQKQNKNQNVSNMIKYWIRYTWFINIHINSRHFYNVTLKYILNLFSSFFFLEKKTKKQKDKSIEKIVVLQKVNLFDVNYEHWAYIFNLWIRVFLPLQILLESPFCPPFYLSKIDFFFNYPIWRKTWKKNLMQHETLFLY